MNVFEGMHFNTLYTSLATSLLFQPVIEMGSWQSTDANPQALRMRELLHVAINYEVPRELDTLRINVAPFLPWADNHFEQERVSGMPINPGETYKEWRYPASAAEHTDFEFSHSYAERYWPQYAGYGNGGKISYQEIIVSKIRPHRGIRHDYGDLWSLVQLLSRDITTRQAYLPIFFPEDLMAALKRERVPCTLGYHFICRQGYLDVIYPMRSCDLTRHFRDDVYLTCRLLLWVLENVKRNTEDSRWENVIPGRMIMNITSLHCFENDEL